VAALAEKPAEEKGETLTDTEINKKAKALLDALV